MKTLPLDVLFASPRQFWPAISGATLRDFYLARALGRTAEVAFAYFTAPGAPLPTAADLPRRELVPVPLPARYTPLQIARGLLGRWPLPVVNYTSRPMQDALRGLLNGRAFDLVQFGGVHMAGYTPLLLRAQPRARLVYDWHNIESEGMARYADNAPAGPRRMYARTTARRLAALEKEILDTAFGHLVCSERERVRLLEISPRARIAVIGNGVDVQAYQPTDTGVRNRVLYVGLMSYHANAEAAELFARRVWPEVRRRFPEWRLTVVGKDPGPSVRALGSLPGVEVTGTVPEVQPYYAEAVASIVPLRVGAGTRLKILEAMSAGVPVISTAIGAEGLDVTPGRDILFADGDEEWVAALESLALRPDLRNSLTQAARTLVEQRYDWDRIGAQLCGTYSRWLAEAK